MLPLGVLSVGSLEIFSNRNSGLSKILFGSFLVSLLAFFLFNLMTEVQMGSFQIIGFVVLMPISMLASPILLMYQTSLMGKSQKLLGKGPIFIHFIPAVYTIIILSIGLTVFSTNELNEILTDQKLDSENHLALIARWVLVSAHVVWYIQLYIYNRMIQGVYRHQRLKYGKFYADYEERNEQLMLRQIVILTLVGVYDLMFWVLRVRSSYLLVIANIIFGALMFYLIVSGREQINKKKYRMYKLSSHEDEIKDRHRLERKRNHH